MKNDLKVVLACTVLALAGPAAATGVVLESGFVTKTQFQAHYKRQGASRHKAPRGAKGLGGETLTGTLSGQWDEVRGALSFPWTAPDGLDLQLVAVSLLAEPIGAEQYAVAGWHREAFFLDMGDGVPRVLSAELVDPDYMPSAGETLFESGQLWTNRYVLYREGAVLARDPDFYADYPDQASVADVDFVSNDQGQVLQIAINIYDEFQNYLYSVEPKPGDFYNPGLIGYDLSDPDVIYVLAYADDLLEIQDRIDLSRRYLIPNGQLDRELPADFDGADLPLSLILEGQTRDGQFSYSAPQDLGYTWGEAKSGVGADASAGPSSGSGMLGGLVCCGLLGLGLRRRIGTTRIRHYAIR